MASSPDRTALTHLAIAETHAWLEHAVIGLDLCPFAKGPHADGRVRLACCDAEAPETLLAVLQAEMALLAAADPSTIETTLLVHPRVLRDFFDYNDFLDVADDALAALDLVGVMQIASFHPDYQFAGTEPDDIGNATNRSPYPTLQLLREASIERAVGRGRDAGDDPGMADEIVTANLQTFETLGVAGWAAVRERCRNEAAAAVAAA